MRTLDHIGGTWTCPNCSYSQVVSYTDISQVGTPICPECDEEMELEDDLTTIEM